MDQHQRQRLIENLKEQGLPGITVGPLPVVPLENFFVGNDDFASIGCNLPDPPGPQAFFDTLRTIRSRPGVQGVLVEVAEVDEQDRGIWPFSERVYLLTCASRGEVEAWLSPLQPDEVAEGWAFGTPAAAPSLRPGMKVYSAWWD